MVMLGTEESLKTDYRPRRPSWTAVAVVVVLLVLALAGLALAGQLNSFLQASLNVLPFVGLAVLASLGETRPWARWLAYLYLLAFGFALLGFSVLMVMAAGLGTTLGGVSQASPEQVATALRPALAYLGVGFGILVLSLLPLAPPIGRALARVLPLRAGSVSSAVALPAVLMLGLLPMAVLAVLGGRPPLLEVINIPGMREALAERSPLQQHLELIYGLIWLLPVALLAVGYPFRRGFATSLERLGLVRPTLPQVGLGLAVAVALVFGATGLDMAIASVWDAFGWQRTDTEAFSQLLGSLISIPGAIVIGVTAGIGEEVAIRGVLQPRVGILLSNLAFTALHAYQYSFDGLLSVFLIGLALGVMRRHTNSTTSAVAHGIYNFILVSAAALGWG